MKKVLGLDLGTNSIGWAVTTQVVDSAGKSSTDNILDSGSRIIPMDMAAMSDFESGNLKSQTAARTLFRGVRRLNERHLLRRERLHRVLNIMGFLPEHYASHIDFDRRPGQFLPNSEPQIAYALNPETNRYEFLFRASFEGMLRDFGQHQPALKNVPYNWTIYYLRKRALTQKIEREELAWIILNFNQKRGYYQTRGDDDDVNQVQEYDELTVSRVEDTEEVKRGIKQYRVYLSDGGDYVVGSRTPLDWEGKTKEFIITHKIDKAGEESSSYKVPNKEDDWTLIKKRTEKKIAESKTTVGCYIYDALLSNPATKIKGALIQTIERDNYLDELISILEKQKEFHPELQDTQLYTKCVEELYRSNSHYRDSIANRGFTYLLARDIIFYHRPLKSKKSQISDCQYEQRAFKDPKTGEIERRGVKCTPRSHPLSEEIRVWQIVQNLKILDLQGESVSSKYLSGEEDRVKLFEALMDRKEIGQKAFLRLFKLKEDQALWNYGDITITLAPVRAEILGRLKKAGVESPLSSCEMQGLWHILYSVSDSRELVKALGSFAANIAPQGVESFVEEFKRMRPFENAYGAYSEKAIKKLLSLMRAGSYWSGEQIDPLTKKRIENIVNGVADDSINERTRDNLKGLSDISQFRGLRLDQACYAVYGRHSEASDTSRWESPESIDKYLKEFKQHSLRNPVVEQLITETLRTVRDIWTKHGAIDEIHVELGRDMRATKKEREKINSRNRENEQTNIRIREVLREINRSNSAVRPESPADQQRLKLYEEGVVGAASKIPDDIAKIMRQYDPSRSDIVRYKCWLEQGYCSPYTGQLIPLSKLFSLDYQVEHIIPQARYFDDSLSNKVICESAINIDKGSMLAYEFMLDKQNKKYTIGEKEVSLLSPELYEQAVKRNFSNSPVKRKKLMLTEIPDSFIERQLNDTRYISKVVRNILSNIVRKEGEVDAISTNIVSVTGAITAKLKEDWGINDVWNNIVKERFIRLNEMRNSNEYGEWVGNKFRVSVPDEYSRGFSKKRLDHRHHAMDAIVIACATRQHINFLNNESARGGNAKTRGEIRSALCGEKHSSGKWVMKKPYKTFNEDVERELREIVVSIKKNTRIITKSTNRYQRIEDGVKVVVKQTKGENRAIRKPLHKDSVYGLVKLQLKRTLSLRVAIDDWQQIVNKKLRSKIKSFVAEGLENKQILAYFKENDNRFEGEDISKVELFYYTNDKESDMKVAIRKPLDKSFDAEKIKSVTDSGIREILQNHLDNYSGDAELAFSPDGVDSLNDNIVALNGGVEHKPIKRVRVSDAKGMKFIVGNVGNKSKKYVVAAKDTNLFFAVYGSTEGKRSYESIPLSVVIENLKQGESVALQRNEKGEELLFTLSPNDFVYLPTADQLTNSNLDLSDILENRERIYKFMSCTGNQAFFIPYFVASPIAAALELGSNNKAERAWSGEMIKESCVKINVSRLGDISYAVK